MIVVMIAHILNLHKDIQKYLLSSFIRHPWSRVDSHLITLPTKLYSNVGKSNPMYVSISMMRDDLTWSYQHMIEQFPLIRECMETSCSFTVIYMQHIARKYP
jgi:hypothetical protein